MRPALKPDRDSFIDAGLRRALTDRLWGGVGFTAAAASAGFAVYMVVVGPGLGHHRSDFGLFATLTHPQVSDAQALPPFHGAPSHARAPGADPVPSATAASGPIDFAPTGTVTPADDKRPADPTAKDPGQTGAVTLPGFVLRDVFDGKALVESRSALTLVAPGSTLEGAGQVLSIERRGESWVVTTTTGIISATAQ